MSGDQARNVVYPALFLDAGDLPGLERGETVHQNASDPGDPEFAPCGGLRSGFQVWTRLDGASTLRHVDVRWIFRSTAGARRYHRRRFLANSEDMCRIAGPPAIGEGTLLFAGEDPFGLGVAMAVTLFSVGPVVAKVFTSGVATEDSLAIARKAERRIGDALAAHPLQEDAGDSRGLVSERWPKGEVAYDGILRGRPLLAGTGIGRLLTFAHGIPDMYQLIGGGEEDMKQPFVYFFTKGSFSLAIAGTLVPETTKFAIDRFRYWDDVSGALRTPDGLTVGSTPDQVRASLGAPDDENEGWLRYRKGIAFGIGRAGLVEAIDLVPAE